jgi:hypothetical protein
MDHVDILFYHFNKQSLIAQKVKVGPTVIIELILQVEEAVEN